MTLDRVTKKHFQTIDHFFYKDWWELLDRKVQSLAEVEIEEGEYSERQEDNPDSRDVVPV